MRNEKSTSLLPKLFYQANLINSDYHNLLWSTFLSSTLSFFLPNSVVPTPSLPLSLSLSHLHPYYPHLFYPSLLVLFALIIPLHYLVSSLSSHICTNFIPPLLFLLILIPIFSPSFHLNLFTPLCFSCYSSSTIYFPSSLRCIICTWRKYLENGYPDYHKTPPNNLKVVRWFLFKDRRICAFKSYPELVLTT